NRNRQAFFHHCFASQFFIGLGFIKHSFITSPLKVGIHVSESVRGIISTWYTSVLLKSVPQEIF
ncbi:MAG: hypothetical protein L0I28_07355, partial [Enterobacterales bacterium]|nr:hypothetical protein [Enterobacterales bacterium]